MFSCFHWKLFRFDDASVSPTSLQNALNTSAYVIFYEMLKTTRNQIVSSAAASAEIKPKVTPAVSPAGPERKVIGPQLPSPAPSVAKIPPSPRTIPSNPKQGPSPLVKPKVITESPIVKKPPPAPVKVGGLVPYDGDSDSDEELNKTKLKTKSPPTPIIAPKPTTAATTSPSPFLPRAVNLKKLKDTIQKEDAPSFSMNNGLKTESKKTEPNRDPSSEILFAKENSAKEESKTIISHSRNEFHVRDIDSHSPSVHSDNSSGSTTSFTVSDIGSGAVRSGSSATDNYLTTSRQKWNVVPHAGSNGSAANGKSEQHSKRERSSPPPGADREDAVSEYSEAGSHGSPKKRKKTALFENGGNILGKFGKEIFNGGAKLFKANKNITDTDDATAGTACEATTSQSHEKASSSKLSADQDEDRQKKHKKKKKKKFKDEKDQSDSESWEEKTKDTLDNFADKVVSSKSEGETVCKKSSFNPEAPVKSWDAKPEKGSGAVTWDGTKAADIAEQLRKSSEIRSWAGDRSRDLERKSLEPRKRSAAQDLDAELDAGRVKKVKKFREDSSKWSGQNPFQMAQEHRNRGDSFSDKPEFQRRKEEFQR